MFGIGDLQTVLRCFGFGNSWLRVEVNDLIVNLFGRRLVRVLMKPFLSLRVDKDNRIFCHLKHQKTLNYFKNQTCQIPSQNSHNHTQKTLQRTVGSCIKTNSSIARHSMHKSNFNKTPIKTIIKFVLILTLSIV